MTYGPNGTPWLPPRPEWGELRLPLFQSAVNETIRIYQVPPKLAYFSALCAATLAVQGLIDVERPYGGTAPVVLYQLIRAQSGERMSEVDRVFLRGFHEDDRREAQKAEFDEKLYADDMNVWKLKFNVLQAAYKRAIENGETGKIPKGNANATQERQHGHSGEEPEVVVSDDARDGPELSAEARAEAALRGHRAHMPKLVKRASWIYRDVTMPALLEQLRLRPIAGLISNEGVTILRHTAQERGGHLESIWSGEQISVGRITRSELRSDNLRLSMSLRLHPLEIEAYRSKSAEKNTDSGLLARMLVFDPGSTAGYRRISTEPPRFDECDRFRRRVVELVEELKLMIAGLDTTPAVVKLSTKATIAWERYADYVERNILIGGRYENAREHAAKLPEIALRLAAIFHRFEGFDGDIGIDTYMAAELLVDSSSYDYQSLFGQDPRGHVDAKRLDDWFTSIFRVRGEFVIEKSLIANKIPNSLRSPGMFTDLLAKLESFGRLSVKKDGATLKIYLNPIF